MRYTIDAIPTKYKGRNFRSRLEAKWAAFFDLCEWKYEYEPLDLNGWFPDFALYGDKGNMILVEVKPVTKFPDDVAQRIQVAASGFGSELLILGQGPFRSDSNYWCIGWLNEDGWEEANWGVWKGSRTAGFCHSINSFEDRMSGIHDGDHFDTEMINPETIWANAGNIVQWQHSESDIS